MAFAFFFFEADAFCFGCGGGFFFLAFAFFFFEAAALLLFFGFSALPFLFVLFVLIVAPNVAEHIVDAAFVFAEFTLKATIDDVELEVAAQVVTVDPALREEDAGPEE